MAADLRPEMRELADYYAKLTPPSVQAEASDTASMERDRKLAVEGVPDAGVPPCALCHNNGTANPRLAGQHAAYMAEQLRLRKAGLGPSTDSAAIMMHIAQQLSDSDISDVANYFETLPAEPSTHSPHLGGAISRVPPGGATPSMGPTAAGE